MFKLPGNVLPRFSLLFATLSLVACGGGGGGSSDGGNDPAPNDGNGSGTVATAVDPGLFDTTIRYDSGDPDRIGFTLLSPSGKYATIVTTAPAPDGTFGTLTFGSEVTFSGSGTNVFRDDTGTWESVDGALEGNVISRGELDATFTPNSGSGSELTLIRDDDLSDLGGGTMEDLAGNYSMDRRTAGGVLTNLEIIPSGTSETSGTVDGSDSEGCVISGTITIPDTTYNVFEADLRLDNCGDIVGGASGEDRGGEYEDIVGVFDPGSNDILFAGTNGKVIALFINDATE